MPSTYEFLRDYSIIRVEKEGAVPADILIDLKYTFGDDTAPSRDPLRRRSAHALIKENVIKHPDLAHLNLVPVKPSYGRLSAAEREQMTDADLASHLCYGGKAWGWARALGPATMERYGRVHSNRAKGGLEKEIKRIKEAVRTGKMTKEDASIFLVGEAVRLNAVASSLLLGAGGGA